MKDDIKSRGKVMLSKPSRFRPRCELCFVRILAKRFPNAEVTGITLSPEQAEFTWKRFQWMIPPLAFGCPPKAQRAGRLAEEAGLTNVKFRVMDALNMEQGDSEVSMTTFANSLYLLKQMSCMKFAQDLCER